MSRKTPLKKSENVKPSNQIEFFIIVRRIQPDIIKKVFL